MRISAQAVEGALHQRREQASNAQFLYEFLPTAVPSGQRFASMVQAARALAHSPHRLAGRPRRH